MATWVGPVGEAVRGRRPVCSGPGAGWQGDDSVSALVSEALADPETAWTMGGFGALASFGRRRDETAAPPASGRLGLVTPRGGLVLDPAGAVPVAYETAFAGGWSQAVALCLPAARCPRTGPGPIRAAGRDEAALRPENRGDKWFDLGLDLPQGRLLLRSADQAALAHLAAMVGRTCAEELDGVPRLMADSLVDVVVATPLGRIEVFGATGLDPDGPRAFLDPRILALERTHVATAPIPDGLVPVVQMAPPHPCRDGQGRVRAFDPARHAAFQALLARWGDPARVRLKARLLAGEDLSSGEANRATRAVARVVRVQTAARTNQDSLKSSPDTPR